MKQMLKLIRLNMSAAISFSAVAGYLFCSREMAWGAIAVFIGVLLLAGAATTLNQ
jgi:hypothetical protein